MKYVSYFAMKLRRLTYVTHPLSIIPEHAYVEYLDINDLTRLRQTHPHFAGRLSQIAKPIIELFASETHWIDYSKLPLQFPKAKLVIGKGHSGVTRTLGLGVLANVTSLDCVDRLRMNLDISMMTNLTFLCLDRCDAIKTEAVDAMTNLVSLSLAGNDEIKGSTVRKLTNLRELNLDSNTTITDLDIDALPLQSLSLVSNWKISPLMLKRFNLTKLNISYYATDALIGEIILCTTVTDLSLNMYDVNQLGQETVAKMTWLRRLTITDPKADIYRELFQYLTNLTYLEFKDCRTIFQVGPLLPLQSLVVKGRKTGYPFDLLHHSLNDLTYLEVHGYDVFLNLNFVTNLTHLDIERPDRRVGEDLVKLKYLKKLVLRECTDWLHIDISGLTSLVSLEILGRVIVRSLVGADGLQSLKIYANNCVVDDSSFLSMRNLRCISLGGISCEGVKGTSFKHLDKLFEVEIGMRNGLDQECLYDLKKRGVVVRYMG
ncbi:MAG: hypothetical protein Harvfovirus2_22 [Harvfovirus sp.]|uniref:Leucine-rich repeat protein n=1 Tax=Harvfovirus sp. TaxID=2487768 RepID=A0A3G5A019_9VIRU|nr:MAG: hypothetical protein Harvfovirus2_22 [Harvfovirus sp.]